MRDPRLRCVVRCALRGPATDGTFLAEEIALSRTLAYWDARLGALAVLAPFASHFSPTRRQRTIPLHTFARLIVLWRVCNVNDEAARTIAGRLPASPNHPGPLPDHRGAGGPPRIRVDAASRHRSLWPPDRAFPTKITLAGATVLAIERTLQSMNTEFWRRATTWWAADRDALGVSATMQS